MFDDLLDAAASVLDLWIGRRARRDRAALAAVDGLVAAVVVTGGSAGIGRAIAHAFARGGAPVLLVARSPERLDAAQAAIVAAVPTAAGRVHTLAVDVAATDAAARIDAALAAHGLYLDVLVNSAAVGLTDSFLAQDPDEIDRLVAVDVAAVTRLTRHAVGQMVPRGRGGVITVGSLAGYVPGPYQAGYYAAKAYVHSLTLAIAEELSGAGVRVLLVAPGPVETTFHARMGSETALYRRLLPAISAERVANSSIVAFKLGRRCVVPGLLPRPVAIALSLLPQRLTVALVGRLLKTRSWLQQFVIDKDGRG
jgi:hypothetical protein